MQGRVPSGTQKKVKDDSEWSALSGKSHGARCLVLGRSHEAAQSCEIPFLVLGEDEGLGFGGLI